MPPRRLPGHHEDAHRDPDVAVAVHRQLQLAGQLPGVGASQGGFDLAGEDGGGAGGDLVEAARVGSRTPAFNEWSVSASRTPLRGGQVRPLLAAAVGEPPVARPVAVTISGAPWSGWGGNGSCRSVGSSSGGGFRGLSIAVTFQGVVTGPTW